MKVLVVGGGGREHAIVMKLSESPLVTGLYCAPGNGGIAKYAKCCPVKATDLEGMLALAKELEVDWVFVAPDDPLALGCVDRLHALGIPCFGPRADAAIIDTADIVFENMYIPIRPGDYNENMRRRKSGEYIL